MSESLRIRRLWSSVARALRVPRIRTTVVRVVATTAALVTGIVALQSLLRPDVTALAEGLTLPLANDRSSVRVRFGGVSTLVFEVDGAPALMTDGFFSRPGLGTILFTKIRPDATAIAYGLERMDLEAVPLIIPLHAHYDHAMDAPCVALRTDARLLGDKSIRNIARGSCLAETRVDAITPGKPMVYGPNREWTLTFIPSEHAPTRFPLRGDITKALQPPAHVSEWREGQTWTLLLEYEPKGKVRKKSFLIHASARYRKGEIARALARRCVDIVFLGVGGAGKQTLSEREELWTETVLAANASRVILIHWDDLFQGLDQPLRPMSYRDDNFARTLEHFKDLANKDKRDLRLPPLFEPFDPYSGLLTKQESCAGSLMKEVRRD